MAKKDKIQEKTLKDYQQSQVNRLTASFDKNQMNLLTSCTGSGKTLVMLTIFTVLQNRARNQGKRIKLMLSTPFKHSVNNIKGYSNMLVHYDTKSKLKLAPVTIGSIASDLNTTQLLSTLSNNHDDTIEVTTHHSLALLYKQLPDDLDLTDYVFAIDEGHHSALSEFDSTQLGKFVDYVLSHNGKILYATATPYREYQNRAALIYNPFDVGCVEVRTIGEQMKAGYSPTVDIRYRQVLDKKGIDGGGELGIYGDKRDAHINKNQLDIYANEFIKLWVNDTYPKSLFLIPAGNSKEYAELVKKTFEKLVFPKSVQNIRGRRNPRVLICLGKSDQYITLDGKKIHALEADRLSEGRYYDIIIGCRKFDEASDVPSVSHLYMIGIPSNTRLFHQRLGRILRDKREVVGYVDWFGSKHYKQSKVVYMTPCGSKIKNFSEQVSRQIAYTTLAGESYFDFCTSMNHISSPRIAISKVANKITNKRDVNLALDVQSFMSSMELEYTANYSRIEFGFHEDTLDKKHSKIVGELYENIIQDVSLNEDEKRNKIFALIQHIKSNKPINWNEFATNTVNSYITQSKKRKNVHLKPSTFIDDAFKDIIDTFRRKEVFTRITKNIEEVYMTLTGEKFSELSKRLSDKLAECPDVVMLYEIKAFKDKYNRGPNINSKDPHEQKLAEFINKTVLTY